MTQVAILPDPLEEVAPPRGRSGASAWTIWLLRRIGLAVLSLWLVSVLVFLATAALGDPVRAILGRDYNSNPGRVAQLEALDVGSVAVDLLAEAPDDQAALVVLDLLGLVEQVGAWPRPAPWPRR